MGLLGSLFGRSSKSRRTRADAISVDGERDDATHRLAGAPVVEGAGDDGSDGERAFDEDEAREDLRAHADAVRGAVRGPGVSVAPGGAVRSTGTFDAALKPSILRRGPSNSGIRPRGVQPAQGSISDVGPQGLSSNPLSGLENVRRQALKSGGVEKPKIDSRIKNAPTQTVFTSRFGLLGRRKMNPSRDRFGELLSRGEGKFAPIAESTAEDDGINPDTGFDADAYEDQLQAKVAMQRRFLRGEISSQEFDRFMGNDVPEVVKPFDAGTPLEVGQLPAPARRPARELPVPDRSPGLSQMWDSMEARSRAEAGARSREKLDFAPEGPRTRNFTTDDVTSEAGAGDRPTHMIEGPEALGDFVAGRQFFRGAGTEDRPHRMRLDDTRYRYRRDPAAEARDVAKPQALLEWERGAADRANQEKDVEGSISASEANVKHLSRGNTFTSWVRRLWNRKSIKKSKGDIAASQQRLAGMRSQWEETDRSLNRPESAPRPMADPESPLSPEFAAGLAADVSAGGTSRPREAEEAPSVRAELDPFYDYAQARSDDILKSTGNVVKDPTLDYRDPREVFPAPDQPVWGQGGYRDYPEWEGEETSVEEGLRRANVKRMYSRENFEKEHEQWRGQMDAIDQKRKEFDKEQRRDKRPAPSLADILARQERGYGEVGYGSDHVDRHARDGVEKEALRRAARKLQGGMSPTSEDADAQLTSKSAEAQRQRGLLGGEDGGGAFPKASAALGALASASSGELTKRQEASDVAAAQAAQKQESRAAFWAPIEQQRVDRQREREEARRVAEEEARRKEQEAGQNDRFQALLAKYANYKAPAAEEQEQAPAQEQSVEAGSGEPKVPESIRRKREAKAARDREEERRMAPLLAQVKAQYAEQARAKFLASADGEVTKNFDPSALSISDRFNPESQDLLAEIDALEQKDRAAAQQRHTSRISAMAEEGGARMSVTNRGMNITDDYTSHVRDREREWTAKLHEQLPYSQTEEGLKDRARHAEITGPDYYQGLSAFQQFQEEKGTAQRFQRGTVAFDYEGGREMTPEERLDAAWTSATARIDDERARRKRNAGSTFFGKVADTMVDKQKVTGDLLSQTMRQIDAPESRSKDVEEVLKTYMDARRTGVDKGLVKRPGAKKSIAPSALPGQDPERLEAFLRERGVMGKKQAATPDLLDAYSMSAPEFARKRLGDMWSSPIEEQPSQEAAVEESQEMMPASRPRQRIMNEALPDGTSGPAGLQQQMQGSASSDGTSLSTESYAEYKARQKARSDFENAIQYAPGSQRTVPQTPAPLPSAPITKEEYLAREAEMNREREEQERFMNTKEGKARAKEAEERIKGMGLSRGEKLADTLDSVKTKLGFGGPKLRSLEGPTGEAAEDLRFHLEDNRMIREANASRQGLEGMVPERTFNQSVEDRTVVQRPGGISLDMNAFYGESAGARANPLSAQRNLVVDPLANSEGMLRVQEGESGNSGRQGMAPIQIADHFALSQVERQQAEAAQAHAQSAGVINLPANAGQQPSGGLGARIMNAIGLGSSSQQAQQPAPVPPAVIRPEHRIAAQRSAQGRQGITEADRAKYVEDTARSIAEREAGNLRNPTFKAPDLRDPTVARSGPGLMDRLEDGMDSMGAQMESGILSGIGQANIPIVSTVANAQNSMNTSARAASAKEQAKAAAKAEAEQRERAEKLQRAQAQGLMKSIVAGARTPGLMGDLYAASSQRKAEGRAGMQDKLLADYDQYQKLRTDYKAKAHKKAEGEYADYTIEKRELPKGDLMREMLVPDFDVSKSMGDIMKGDKVKHGYYRVPRR